MCAVWMQSCASCHAEVLSLPGVWNRGLEQNYDVRLGKIASAGRKADIKIARADYYPQVQAVASTEYDKSFAAVPQGVAFVGTTTITGATRFQDVVSFYSTYTAFDWGVRANTLKAAKRVYEASRINERAVARDLKLTPRRSLLPGIDRVQIASRQGTRITALS